MGTLFVYGAIDWQIGDTFCILSYRAINWQIGTYFAYEAIDRQIGTLCIKAIDR